MCKHGKVQWSFGISRVFRASCDHLLVKCCPCFSPEIGRLCGWWHWGSEHITLTSDAIGIQKEPQKQGAASEHVLGYSLAAMCTQERSCGSSPALYHPLPTTALVIASTVLPFPVHACSEQSLCLGISTATCRRYSPGVEVDSSTAWTGDFLCWGQSCTVPGKDTAHQGGCSENSCMYLPRLPQASLLNIGKTLHRNLTVMFGKNFLLFNTINKW